MENTKQENLAVGTTTVRVTDENGKSIDLVNNNSEATEIVDNKKKRKLTRHTPISELDNYFNGNRKERRKRAKNFRRNATKKG